LNEQIKTTEILMLLRTNTLASNARMTEACSKFFSWVTDLLFTRYKQAMKFFFNCLVAQFPQ